MTDLPPVHEIRDPGNGQLLGFIGIDSTIAGRARGGLRMVPDLSAIEIAKLARAMTLKYGFLGLPQGGGKAGLFGDPEATPAQRAAALARFATAAEPFLRPRRYVPDADMGTTGPEIQAMLSSLGLRSGSREYRGSRSGDYTAATVHASALAAAAALGLPWQGTRVAIEGFGKVGAPLARFCVDSGASVVAVSTRDGAIYEPTGLNINKLHSISLLSPRRALELYLAACPTAQRLSLEELKQVPAEVFCPCARHDSLTAENAASLPASVISCGANSPLTAEAEQILHARGALVVPDFVANSGGVLGGTMEFAGWRYDEILHFCAGPFHDRVARLLAEGRVLGAGMRAHAEAEALRRFHSVKTHAEARSLRGRIAEAGLAAYREGWIPGRVVRRLSERYFRSAAG